LIERTATTESLVNSYLKPWQSLFPWETLQKAKSVSPLVAVFACALADTRWRSAGALKDTALAGYFRSLTRRMDREATKWAEGSKRCTA
jgi:hypothetical protein